MTDPTAPESRTVTAAESGTRLDRVLAAALADLSRTRIQALIQDARVTSGGETITDASYRVKQGQTFTVSVPPTADTAVRPQAIALDVRYEDADLLVVDKPAGLVVHPGPGRPDSTLVNALLAHCGDSLSGIGGVKRPGIVHRLDKDTSGLIVIAKNDAAHRALSRQFSQRTIDRLYQAVAWGVPVPPAGRIEGNIGRHPRQRKKMTVLSGARGKPAVTRYKVARRFGDKASLLECRLETGRTHQIRVHLAHIGHPLIGDPVYGRRTPARMKGVPDETAAQLRSFPRQALHAAVIGFDHPITEKRLKFTSSYPHDIQQLIKSLEEL